MKPNLVDRTCKLLKSTATTESCTIKLLESSYGNIPSCSWPNHSSDAVKWSSRGGLALRPKSWPWCATAALTLSTGLTCTYLQATEESSIFLPVPTSRNISLAVVLGSLVVLKDKIVVFGPGVGVGLGSQALVNICAMLISYELVIHERQTLFTWIACCFAFSCRTQSSCSVRKVMPTRLSLWQPPVSRSLQQLVVPVQEYLTSPSSSPAVARYPRPRRLRQPRPRDDPALKSTRWRTFLEEHRTCERSNWSPLTRRTTSWLWETLAEHRP